MSEKSIAFCVNNLILSETCHENGNNIKSSCNTNSKSNFNKELNEIKVELCSRDLWLKFYKLGTEMIITKAGSRRMFPIIRTRVCGMKEEIMYNVILELMPVDNFRYRFDHITGEWIATSGKLMTENESSGYILHPASPALGKFWINQGSLSFDKIKLTNTKRPSLRDHVSLSSMRKYMAKIHISFYSESELTLPSIEEHSVSFSFPETTFIAVTAYQNNKITKLKCACNPLATAIRSTKRQSQYFDWTKISPKFTISTGGDIKRHKHSRNDRKICINRESGVLQIPIKFIIPPLHTNLMSDWSKL
ncbi:T-box transcription factor TBX22-like [Arctopsyche grandis]|uniref:T-box transcription factor TBX22-like n=1 Tax=Arctopsyche grandis TaxID=121162 RepID=UPI00406D8382